MKLTTPLKIGTTTLTELKFRDYATAEDLLAFDEAGPNKQAIALVASLTGQDEAVIRKLSITDFKEADRLASELLKGQADEKNA